MTSTLARLKWRTSAPTSPDSLLVTLLAALMVAVAMAWMGHACTLHHGLTFVRAWFVVLHVGWLSAAAAIGSTGGLDPDVLLRFPLSPGTLFRFNVMATLFDRVGVVMLASLAGTAVAAFTRWGPGFGVRLSVAAVALAVTTACIVHLATAVAARFISRRWQRTLTWVVVGASATALMVVAGQRLSASLALAGSRPGVLLDVLHPLARLSAWVPSTALSTRALPGEPLGAGLSFLAGALALAAVLLAAGGAIMGPSVASQGHTRPAPLRARALTRGRDRPRPVVSTLVQRELRYFLRDPFLLARALVTAGLLAALVALERGFLGGAGPFLMGNLPLTPIIAVAINHFGMDHKGLPLLLLTPVPERSIVLAKNLAFAGISLGVAVLGLAPGVLLRQVSLGRSFQLLFVLLIAVPYVLALSNRLSIQNPHQIAFQVGGVPLANTAGTFSVILLLLVLAGAQWYLSRSAVGGTVGSLMIGLVGVILWDRSVAMEGRHLIDRREKLLAALKLA